MSLDQDNIDGVETSDEQIGSDLAQTLGGGEGDFIYEAEPKQSNRTAALLLLLVLVAGAGAYFMYFRKGPAPAAAAPAGAATADQTITQFLNSGSQNIKQMQEMLRNTEGIVQQFRSYPGMRQVPLSQLQTNPFRFGNPADNAAGPPVANSREQERNQAIKAVRQLVLRSIMHSGTHRACMINDQLYMEGQQVDQFTIERITPDSVIVRTGVYRFELKMQ